MLFRSVPDVSILNSVCESLYSVISVEDSLFICVHIYSILQVEATLTMTAGGGWNKVLPPITSMLKICCK